MGLERILVTRDFLRPLLVLAVIHVSMIPAEKREILRTRSPMNKKVPWGLERKYTISAEHQAEYEGEHKAPVNNR